MNNSIDILKSEAIGLLKALIAVPSFSREEDKTAQIIFDFLQTRGIKTERLGNNVYAFNKHTDTNKPYILLNSHHDTVKPSKLYTNDPFDPFVKDGKLFGLGSNDAGGCLVSLLALFLHFYDRKDLPFNLIFAGTAEEEISGSEGIERLIPQLPTISYALVGEPTKMQMAVAERGLMVIDCLAVGKAGHAAREEGDNSIYKALDDINWFRHFHFDKVSDLLGPVKMSVTVIDTENKAHNVVPAHCRFVVDTRVNELYSFEEVLDTMRHHVSCELHPRSLRLRSTSINLDHPIVKAGSSLGLTYYGSPTTSDKALMPFPALKIGPGDSARSHTADEYIYLHEIEEGIELYIQILNKVIA